MDMEYTNTKHKWITNKYFSGDVNGKPNAVTYCSICGVFKSLQKQYPECNNLKTIKKNYL